MIRERLERLEGPNERDPSFELAQILDLAERLSLTLDLYEAQNFVWQIVRGPRGQALEREILHRIAKKFWFDPATLEARARPSAPDTDRIPNDDSEPLHPPERSPFCHTPMAI